MLATYASHRKTPVDFTVTSIPGTAENLVRNIRIQYANRAGRSLLSAPQQVTGTGVRVTLNEGLILLGEEVFWIVVSVETTGNATDAAIVAQWQARDNGQVVRRSLPVNIDLTTDEHFVTNRVELPSTGMLPGAIAMVIETGKYYRYDPESYVDEDGVIRSYNAYTEGLGKWVAHNGTNLAYLASTTAQYGSDLRLSTVERPLKVPPKVGNDNSVAMRYWLNNQGQSPIVEGRFTFEIKVNGLPNYEAIFANKITYYLRGYVDRDSGILDASLPEVGAAKVWNPTRAIALGADLLSNHAAVFDIVFTFNNDDMLGILPTQTPEIELNVVQVLQLGGELSEVAEVTGSLIFKDLDRFLIVPGLIRLSGMAMIATDSSQGFKIRDKNQQQISVEVADTPGQQVVMAGSLRGLSRIKQGELGYSEVLRALISTEAGLSRLVASSTIAIANQGITVTVTQPISETGTGIVRADYPDGAIAGNTQGRFTPTQGFLLVNLDGVVYQSQPLTITALKSQVFTFTDLGNFTLLGELPLDSDPEFSLFEALDVTVATSTGTISGEVIVYFCYSYPSPNLTVTKINHVATGTVPMLNKTLAEAINDSLSRAENLNDLPDKVVARENLNVYSTEFVNQSQAVQDLRINQLEAIASYAYREITELDYTLTAQDHAHELYIKQPLTGKIIIPNDVSGFADNYQLWISLEVPANIEYDRADGLQTDLHFTNGDRFQKSIGQLAIIRRKGTSIFWITGQLES